MGTIADLDEEAKRKMTYPCRESNPDRPATAQCRHSSLYMQHEFLDFYLQVHSEICLRQENIQVRTEGYTVQYLLGRTRCKMKLS
jgi:hypothetical protein